VIGVSMMAMSLGLASQAPFGASTEPARTVSWQPILALQPPPSKSTPRAATLMLWAEGSPIIIGADGKKVLRLDPADWIKPGDAYQGGLSLGRRSPDGKTMLYSEVSDANSPKIDFRQVIRRLEPGDKPAELIAGLRGLSAFWSRDGSLIYASGYNPEKHDKRAGNELGPYEMDN
jgi:hypothetical protein